VNGWINAIFFNTDTIQQGLLSNHWWEPIPLPNNLMCMNYCSKDCHFDGTLAWSTMHLFFAEDPKSFVCDKIALDCGVLGLSCCPRS